MAEDLYRLHRIACAPEAATPLYAILADGASGLSRHKARLAVTAGLCKVDGVLAADPQHLVEGAVSIELDLRHGIPTKGAQVRARSEGGQRQPREAPFRILHEDPHVAVIDKAAGILSAPVDSDSREHIPAMLRNYWRKRGGGDKFIGVVHRIDQATSGCLVIARSAEAQRILQTQFASHSAGRRYRALVAGGPRRDEDTLTGKLGHGKDGRRCVVPDGIPGKDAITHFKVRQRYGQGSDVECWLETGRTHQIRIHLASIGCPVLGDPVYGPQPRQRKRDGLPPLPKAPRLMLHAWSVAFDHPIGGTRLEVEAPLPTVFGEVAGSLR